MGRVSVTMSGAVNMRMIGVRMMVVSVAMRMPV